MTVRADVHAIRVLFRMLPNRGVPLLPFRRLVARESGWAENSTVVSKAVPAANAAQPAVVYHFDYAEGWQPNFGAARSGDVIRFLLSGRIWGPVTSDDITILVRKPAASAPTVILTPGQ